LAGRRELGALRLVREVSFLSLWSCPSATFRCGSPKEVFRFMEPCARREETDGHQGRCKIFGVEADTPLE
jgi:hypothetical protein